MPALYVLNGNIDDRNTMSEQKPWWAQQTPLTEPKTTSSAPSGISIQRGVVSVVASFTAIVVGLVTFLIIGPNPELPRKNMFQSIAYPADTESLIAQCGETFTYTPDKKHYGAIPEDFFKDPAGGPDTINRTIPNHPMRVPAYGFFVNNDRIEFKQKFYTEQDVKPVQTAQGAIPRIQRLEYLKTMWEGKKIIWYMPTIDQMTKDSIKEFVTGREDVVAIPWQDEASIPMQRNFAFSAWNVTRSCGLWDSDVATSFTEFADDYNKDRDTENIPEAPVDSSGELPLIDVPS